MNRFIKWASEVRQKEGLSYRAFGDKIGMSHTHVFDNLNERQPLSWDFVAKTSVAFGLDVIEGFLMAGLLNDKGGESVDSPAPIGEMS